MIISLKKKRFYQNIKYFPIKFSEISRNENWNEIISQTLQLIDAFNESCIRSYDKKIEEDNSKSDDSNFKMSINNKVKNSGVILGKIQSAFLNFKKVTQSNYITAEIPSRDIEKRCKNIMKAFEAWSNTLDIGPEKYSFSPLAVLHSKEIQNVFLEIKKIFEGDNSKFKLRLENLMNEAKTQKEFLEKLIEVNQNIFKSIENKNYKIDEQFEKAREVLKKFNKKEPLKNIQLLGLSGSIDMFIESLDELLGFHADEFSNSSLAGLQIAEKHTLSAIEGSSKIIFKEEIKGEISKIILYAQSFEYKPKIKHTRKNRAKNL